MKRGTPDHPKTRRLMRLLGLETWAACGLLEVLWHFTAKHAIRGDVGRWTNEEIAEGIGWGGDADKLINALVESRWIERDQTHRLIVHDWHEHCDDSVAKTIKNRGEKFLSIRAVSGNIATFPENSGNGRPSHSLATPSHQPSPAKPSENGGGVGWAEIAKMLSERNVVAFATTRPEDQDATPDEIKAVIAVWDDNHGEMQCKDPHSLLVNRIRQHVHGMGSGKGWPRRRRS